MPRLAAKAPYFFWESGGYLRIKGDGARQTSGLCFPAFDRYVGIDYSGAETPTASLPGLRVYMAARTSPPAEVRPPTSPRKHWTRRGIAEWLAKLLNEDRPTLVGIDHGFSFPLQYFRQHNLVHDWPAFLEDFQRHWPTDGDRVYVDFVRHGERGNWAARSGHSRWRRLTEERVGAKSVIHFDVPGSVAKSTHAGLPWPRFLRERTAGPFPLLAFRRLDRSARPLSGGRGVPVAVVWTLLTRFCAPRLAEQLTVSAAS